MIDKYVEKMLDSSKELIKSEDYFIAGNKLVKIAEYGIIVENPVLTFLGSELSDVFKNCFEQVKEFKKTLEMSMINKIIEDVFKLMDIMKKNINEFDDNLKIRVFDLLLDVISKAEKLQIDIMELEGKRGFKRRTIRKIYG